MTISEFKSQRKERSFNLCSVAGYICLRFITPYLSTYFINRKTKPNTITVFMIFTGFLSGLFTNFPIIGKLNIMDLISYIYFILILIPGLAQSVRRMHDVNKSGWYLLMSLIPIVGWIIVLVQECSPSVDVNNNYGTKL